VEEFNNTYNYCLLPVEGMQAWPELDRPPLQAPGYVRMPGRPKKERKREPSEKPKAPKISRVGTIIRCRKCKQIGHNRSTCDKRNGTTQTSDRSGNAQSNIAPQQSCSATASLKRKAPSSTTGNASTTLGTSATKNM
jgi:alpha-galactosidase